MHGSDGCGDVHGGQEGCEAQGTDEGHGSAPTQQQVPLPNEQDDVVLGHRPAGGVKPS